jgi:formylglycine-generating enzyme required for sulfatase activity
VVRLPGAAKARVRALRAKGAVALAAAVVLAGCGGEQELHDCPAGMVLVPGGAFRYGTALTAGSGSERRKPTKETVSAFCIDRYEFPNREGALPRTEVSWLEAAASCRREGRRLCSEYEWEKACRGRDGLLYPWGDHFDPTACALDPREPGRHRSGARPRCVSPYGVYDMAGSVWEWTLNSWEGDSSRRVLRGGWEPEIGDLAALCSYRRPHGASAGGARIGFRCCAGARSAVPPPPSFDRATEGWRPH